MHTFSETGAGVPAFLAKLWRLVDDPETNNLICWSKDGRSFIIQNQAQFARELLPLNYKHNNMASFIRQLNMYGFHKITSIDNGGLKFDRDEMEFSHPCFKRNCPYLLEHIKRKIANTKTLEDKSGIKPEAVSKVLQDVKAMRGRQDSLDSRFSVMKQENEALWREIASLRQKHAKQQQIVNKLIQFLITIVQPSRNMTGVKRHMQLMINDSPENSKLRKTSETESECGPVIHELSEELLDEVADVDADADAETDLIDPNSPYVKMECPGQGRDHDDTPSPLQEERPHSSISQISQQYDYSNQSAEDALMLANPTASAVGPNGTGKLNSPPLAAGPTDSSIIQSVNPDGSHIFYHVTEVPDGPEGNTHENKSAASPNYNEENVLTTPMVRVQMARTQQLKQKNKQRRKQGGGGATVAATATNANEAVGALTAKMPRLLQHHPNVQSPGGQQQQQRQRPSPPPMGGNTQRIAAMKIKAEKVMDPMAFLNVYPDERVLTPEPALISPTMSEDSRQSNAANVGLLSSSNGNAMVTPLPQGSDDRSLLGNSADFYNPNDFISGDMPADIFEDSSLMSNEGTNYNNQQQQEQQQHRLLRSATNGKLSSYSMGNGGGNSSTGASTSAAAAAAAAANNNQFVGSSGAAATSSSNNTNGSNKNSNVVVATQGKNGNNMTLAKYNKNGYGSEDIMRLSTPDEVSGHLDNVQDELESLKDLLRSDNYSLDANTLLGLFNDPDILDPYGLALSTDNSSDKKELIHYQPVYDLSDIININSNNELEVNDGESAPLTPQSSRHLQALESGSTLNTPYHE